MISCTKNGAGLLFKHISTTNANAIHLSTSKMCHTRAFRHRIFSEFAKLAHTARRPSTSTAAAAAFSVGLASTGLALLFSTASTRFGALQGIRRAPSEEDADEEGLKIPRRLKRFRKFASIEYDGEIFMSPQDFLDSLILDEPRERVFRTVINAAQLRKMLKDTPPLRRGSHRMFRELGECGIISYAEYLFLVTLLTKSQMAFNVAFIMFDEDENMQIDKEEFLKIQFLIIAGRGRPSSADDEQLEEDEVDIESEQCRLDVDFRLFQGALPTRIWPDDGGKKGEEGKFERLINSNVLFHAKTRERLWRERREREEQLAQAGGSAGANAALATPATAMEQAISEAKEHDTTLTIHLFGRNGRDSLSLDQFQTFYQHLQKELIEIEFKEFSRGKERISSVDFARLVLRYSILHKEQQSPYIRRVYERSEYDDEGISLQQFETFSMFLNNLEDFSKAVRLYALAEIPVSQSEFIRAVRCSTGFELDPALVNVLFKIFDANADDKLSYSEFIAVMSDRLSRGFKKTKHEKPFGLRQLRDCVRNELMARGSGSI